MGPARINADDGWTTRQMRMVLLIVAALVVVIVLLVRGSSQPEPDQAVDVPEPVADPLQGIEPAEDLTPVEPDAPTRTRERRGFAMEGTDVADVETALTAADAAMAAGQLYEPPEDNAVAHLLAARRLAPDDPAVAERLDTVGAALLGQLDQALNQRALERAGEIGHVLESVFGDDPRPAEALARLTRLRRAEDFFVAGVEDMVADRLVRPPGSNALARLTRARELDPERDEIHSALEALQSRLLGRAVAAARRHEFERAERLLRQARTIGEQSGQAERVADRVMRFRQQRIDALSEEARAAIHGGDWSAARDLIARAGELGASQNEIGVLRGELGHARLYGNYAVGEVFVDPVGDDSLGPRMVVLPHGYFEMGSPPDDPDHRTWEEPEHRVHFRRGFAISQGEISVGDFAAFVAATGYETDAERENFSFIYDESSGRMIRRSGIDWRKDYGGRDADADLPVLHVSWNDARAYAAWLREATGQPYRMVTEAEHEYAQRGGSTGPYWWGYGAPEMPVENLTGSHDRSRRYRRSWNQAFEGYGDGQWGPAPVRSFVANPMGVFDSAGNVQEWVADCWHDSYVRAPTDGSAWVNRGCERRVVRGGFWGGAPETARSAWRTHHPPEQRGNAIGFRVVRELGVP